MRSIILNDQIPMPELGYGLWQVSDTDTETLVAEALRIGYRSIDCAQVYQNEAGLGRAIAGCALPRESIFITTKIWNSEQGFDATRRSFEVSLKKLGLDHVDLLLIHWPAPAKNLYVETWKALIEIQKEGRVRSIGVSNFHEEHLKRIIHETSIVPSINQIELHPHFQQKELRDFHQRTGIQTEAWSPLGQGKVLRDPVIGEIAKKNQRTPAQVILRWHLQNNLIAIPKTVHPERMKENYNIFDFELSADDMKLMESLDRSEGRVGPNPDTAAF